MSQFTYKARDNSGKLIDGLINAVSANEAQTMLRGEGKFIVELQPVNTKSKKLEQAKKEGVKRGRIKRKEIISFTNQLSVMIDTGVPISEALECAVDQSSNLAFREVLAEVSNHVQSGNDLSSALAKFPKVFPPVMVSLVSAAEASGTLAEMLERISQYLAKEHATLRKIKGAITYPSVMLGFSLVVTGFLIAFVLPRFAGIYESRGAALPAPTAFLMGLSELTSTYWHFTLGGIVAGLLGLWAFFRTPNGQRIIDTLKIYTPGIGPLFQKMYITRACRTLGTMTQAGVPILDMVQIVRAVTQNSYYDQLWDEVDEELQRGSELSLAFKSSKLIPRSVSQMIVSGEKSGRLGEVLDKVAVYTEEEFDEQVKQTTQYIEPIMIIAMGSLIGFVAISLLLPIFSVSTVVSG